MKHTYWLLLFTFLFSCTNQTEEKSSESAISKPKTESKEVYQSTFQKIMDRANLKGAILIYDPQTDVYFSNDFRWAKKGQLPASTFKIPNSMIALETKVVEDEQTMFKWDGQKRMVKTWEQDLIFKDAFKFSCVPCYQDIARRVGVNRMNAWVAKLNYGSKIAVDSTNIDLFWLIGDWRITPFQEIDFLKRLYDSKLPISKRTESLVKELMIMEQKENYTLRGKTGWSMIGDFNNGWFVGYLETNGKLFFFATNVEPDEGFDMKEFPAIRKIITMEALALIQ